MLVFCFFFVPLWPNRQTAMYRYIVMASAIAVTFIIIYVLLDVIFREPIEWSTVLMEGVIFGVVMTVVQYYQEKKKQE